MSELLIGGLGLAVGLLVGWEGGRRTERAAVAWELTWARYVVARALTGHAVGWVLGCLALGVLGVWAVWVAR